MLRRYCKCKKRLYQRLAEKGQHSKAEAGSVPARTSCSALTKRMQRILAVRLQSAQRWQCTAAAGNGSLTHIQHSQVISISGTTNGEYFAWKVSPKNFLLPDRRAFDGWYCHVKIRLMSLQTAVDYNLSLLTTSKNYLAT